jgi:hypothetical protein
MPTDETPMPTDETTEAFQLLLREAFQKIGSRHGLPIPSMEAIASAAALFNALTADQIWSPDHTDDSMRPAYAPPPAHEELRAFLGGARAIAQHGPRAIAREIAASTHAEREGCPPTFSAAQQEALWALLTAIRQAEPALLAMKRIADEAQAEVDAEGRRKGTSDWHAMAIVIANQAAAMWHEANSVTGHAAGGAGEPPPLRLSYDYLDGPIVWIVKELLVLLGHGHHSADAVRKALKRLRDDAAS